MLLWFLMSFLVGLLLLGDHHGVVVVIQVIDLLILDVVYPDIPGAMLGWALRAHIGRAA
jgi:hypothetical protein